MLLLLLCQHLSKQPCVQSMFKPYFTITKSTHPTPFFTPAKVTLHQPAGEVVCQLLDSYLLLQEPRQPLTYIPSCSLISNFSASTSSSLLIAP